MAILLSTGAAPSPSGTSPSTEFRRGPDVPRSRGAPRCRFGPIFELCRRQPGDLVGKPRFRHLQMRDESLAIEGVGRRGGQSRGKGEQKDHEAEHSAYWNTCRPLLEEQWGEFVQIVSPVDPGV